MLESEIEQVSEFLQRAGKCAYMRQFYENEGNMGHCLLEWLIGQCFERIAIQIEMVISYFKMPCATGFSTIPLFLYDSNFGTGITLFDAISV